jgi:predicted nucleotidyltransferase
MRGTLCEIPLKAKTCYNQPNWKKWKPPEMRWTYMDKKQIEEIIKSQKQYLEEHFYVKKIGLFGSFVRSEQHEDSDIDMLVEFNRPVGFEFIRLKFYLESILDRKVDLVTEDALKPLIKDHILSEVQYH